MKLDECRPAKRFGPFGLGMPRTRVGADQACRLVLGCLALLAGSLGVPRQTLGQQTSYSYNGEGDLIARASTSLAAPQILRPPQAQVAASGASASFSVVLADATGAQFQWKFNGANLAGATRDSLVVTGVSAASEGQYSVTVTNAAGSVTSASAMLWFDSDGDGLPDSWEIANFGNLAQNALGDFDGDGVSNLDEFLQGTNPASNTSYRARLTVLTSGGGSVSVSPAKTNYALGETVTLTAVPATPYSFDHWSGDLSSTASTTTLTLTANKTVTAVFSYAPVPPGLIAWWRGEADASDLLGAHNGTFYSGNTPVSPTVTAAGLVGGALSFDGTKHVRVPDASDLRPERLTVEMWVYPTVQTSSAQTLFARGSSTGSRPSWSFDVVNGYLSVSHYGFSGRTLTDTAYTGALPLNQWTHAAATFDGTNWRLYANGAYVGGSLAESGIYYDPSAVPVTIGSGWVAGASANRFTGLIDELSFYNRAQSAPEVAAIAAVGRIGKTLAQPYFTTPAPLADGVVGDAYAINLGAAIGTAPYAFSLASGALPPGLSLTEAGALNGTPAAPGDYAFTLAVRDATGRFNERAYSLHVTRRIAPPLGMVGWWRGEPDASGLVKDQIGGHDGTYYLSGATMNSVTAVGKVGRTLDFTNNADGSAYSYVRVPDDASLRPALVTGEAWVYPYQSVFDGTVLCKGAGSDGYYTWRLGISSGYPKLISKHQNNSYNALTGPTRLPLNQWSHVAFTFDGSTTTLYVNGVAVSWQVGLGPLVYASSVPLTIGSDWRFSAPTEYFSGRADEVSLYNRALAAREIAALFAAGAAGKTLTGPFSIDLGNAAVGRAFLANFSFPTGASPITYSLVSGTLPPGFILGSNGTLSGTTATRGDFTFTVRATDANGAYQDQTATVHSYLPASRPPGLISWYRAENNALDAVGANHGTLTGATSYGAGKVGTAFTLHGNGDTVQIPDSPSLQPPVITVETWVNMQDTDSTCVFVGKTVGSGPADTWTLYYVYGQLHTQVTTTSSSGGFDVSANWLPQRNRWYHLAMTYDGAQLRLYIDGAQVAAAVAEGALTYDSHPVVIGADIENESLAYYFNGQIDETAIYNRALTDTEIAGIYAADLAGKAPPGYGDNEDLDNDGLVNVVEYGLSSDLSKGNGLPATLGTVTNPDGSVQLKISLLRDPAKTDATITIESSGDLQDWVPIATSVNGTAFTGIATVLGEVSGSAPRVVTIIDPYAEPAGQGRGFLRVRVTR